MQLLKQLFRRKDQSSEFGTTGGRWGLRVILGLIVLVVLAGLVVMILNYRFPRFFDLDAGHKKQGVLFTETLIKITEEMTSNWLPNDKVWPTICLDNPQNFQLGQLEAVRYTVRVMRDKLSRLRTTDKIDPDTEAAFVFFSNDPFKWVLPSAESKFKAGVRSLKSYNDRLLVDQASFHPRADNLIDLLDQYLSLLGGINTRLSLAPKRHGQVLSQETAGDAYTQGEKLIQAKVPWTQIDDNFYYARGAAYVIREMMLAARQEFKHILEVKKAHELVDRIILVLDDSQFEPLIVLNGDFGSVLANHSLQLQSVLEDARQKMGSLLSMLTS
ncbi:MAG: DUF2333 family protein [Thermodesulfobacteriota bacterium]